MDPLQVWNTSGVGAREVNQKKTVTFKCFEVHTLCTLHCSIHLVHHHLSLIPSLLGHCHIHHTLHCSYHRSSPGSWLLGGIPPFSGCILQSQIIQPHGYDPACSSCLTPTISLRSNVIYINQKITCQLAITFPPLTYPGYPRLVGLASR